MHINTEKRKILIVDDDDAILDALQLLLEDNGFEAQVCNDGHKVMSWDEELPDLILLDIWMSGVNGKDVCMCLKKQAETKDIPVIMISANRDTQQIAYEAGADDFLPKPFGVEDLLNKINKYLH